jgi:hypothetical protein
MTSGSIFGDPSDDQGFSDEWFKTWRKRFPAGFFPMKMKLTEDGEVSTLEVTKIEKKPVSDDLFKPPAGYTAGRIGGGA